MVLVFEDVLFYNIAQKTPVLVIRNTSADYGFSDIFPTRNLSVNLANQTSD